MRPHKSTTDSTRMVIGQSQALGFHRTHTINTACNEQTHHRTNYSATRLMHLSRIESATDAYAFSYFCIICVPEVTKRSGFPFTCSKFTYIAKAYGEPYLLGFECSVNCRSSYSPFYFTPTIQSDKTSSAKIIEQG